MRTEIATLAVSAIAPLVATQSGALEVPEGMPWWVQALLYAGGPTAALIVGRLSRTAAKMLRAWSKARKQAALKMLNNANPDDDREGLAILATAELAEAAAEGLEGAADQNKKGPR